MEERINEIVTRLSRAHVELEEARQALDEVERRKNNTNSRFQYFREEMTNARVNMARREQECQTLNYCIDVLRGVQQPQEDRGQTEESISVGQRIEAPEDLSPARRMMMAVKDILKDGDKPASEIINELQNSGFDLSRKQSVYNILSEMKRQGIVLHQGQGQPYTLAEAPGA
jgi:chromosome segregation ATPase